MIIKFSNNCSIEEQNKLKESQKWILWISNLKNNFIVNDIFVYKIHMFGENVGFVHVEVNCTDLEGNNVPGIAFIRGNSVSILTIIVNSDNNEKFVLFTEQSRVPAGKKLLESPAGMIDEGEPSVKALEELKEEVGLDIFNNSKLIKLSGGYTSPGGIDEYVDIYVYELSLNSEEIMTLNGSITGNKSENEIIKLKIVPFKDSLNKTESLMTKLALFEYMAL